VDGEGNTLIEEGEEKEERNGKAVLTNHYEAKNLQRG